MIISSSLLVFSLALATAPAVAVAPASVPVLPDQQLRAALVGLDFPAGLVGQEVTQPEWQRQYDTAKARRKSGLRKVVIGLVMEGGGVAMMMVATTSCINDLFVDDCSGSSAIVTLGAVTAVAGAVPFWWGVIQWVDANSDVHSLEATRPRSASDVKVIRLTDHQAVAYSTGRRRTIGLQLSW